MNSRIARHGSILMHLESLLVSLAHSWIALIQQLLWRRVYSDSKIAPWDQTPGMESRPNFPDTWKCSDMQISAVVTCLDVS